MGFALAPVALWACGAEEAPGGPDDEPPYLDAGGHGSPSPPPPPSGGEWGATPGGAQDIGYARELIAMGEVPSPDVITTEGLISEHDLPAHGPPCDDLICLRPSLGVAPDLSTGTRAHWIHVGMTSGLEQPFSRPPLDLVVAIDKSSSMSIDMEETTEAVARLIDKLGDDDRVAILAFDTEIRTIHPLGPVEDAASLKDEVRAIAASGDWDIHTATERAYDLLLDAGPSPDRMERVMILSCGYPNVDEDGDDPFSRLVLEGADQGIGISFFGVLLGYSAHLADLFGRTPGGSYHYLQDLEQTVQVFDEDFDFMVTPLGYDLRFALEPVPPFELEAMHGIPGDSGEPAPEFEVATVFLSSRRGGMVARLTAADEPEDGGGIADLSLSYTAEPALGVKDDEADKSESVAAPADLDGEAYYEGNGVRKAVALVNQAERMRAACAAYHDGRADEAAEILAELAEYLAREATAIGDSDLEGEVELVEALLANVQ